MIQSARDAGRSGDCKRKPEGNLMKITITNRILSQGIPQPLERELIDRLTFPNSVYLEAKRMGRWLGNLDEYLSCYERIRDGLLLPRGYTRRLISLCRRHGVNFHIEDLRRTLPEVDFVFQGELRPFQEIAVRDVLSRGFGTLSAPTGSGKTVMALATIAASRQPTLIIVHTKELLYQWQDRGVQFLDLQEDEIGLIGDGKKTIGPRLTIGIVNSVYKIADEIREHVGHLIVDECHRTPSRTFTEAVTAFDSKYMLGLSATPWRRDKLSRLIYWYLGDVVHEVKKEDLLQTGDILPAEVIIRETDFRTWLDPSEEYSTMLTELTRDPERNQLIASDVAREADNGAGICLVLSDRKAHCETLHGLLKRHGLASELLTGDVSNGNRQQVIDRLNQGKVRVLIATGQLVGEGFDCKKLSILFLATPIRFDGRVIQYLGRVLRPAPGKKKARVYDYQDVQIPVLVASAKARERVFESLKNPYENCQPLNQKSW